PAALAAAREGAKTLLLEHFGSVGGVAVTGMMSHWTGESEGPIYEEILRRCHELQYGDEDPDPKADWKRIHHEKYKLVLLDMLEEAGVTLQLHTTVSGAIMEGKRVVGVVTESKSGREAVYGKVIIDATGDGDVAFKAGAEFELGREGDHQMQPVTVMFKLAGVDWERAIFPPSFETTVQVPAGEIQALGREHLPAPAGHTLLYKGTVPGQVVVNMTNQIGIDGTNVRDLTKAEIACRRQIPLIVKFLRQYAPGYEKCYVIGSAEMVGVRETRHFVGMHTITPEEIVEAKKPADWIATRCHFNFDIHSLSGAGLDKNGEQHHFKSNGKYYVPYGACLPKTIDGLLLSGRNISGTHKAHSNFRAMPVCANVGQGVGTAAAIAARKNVLPRDLDVREVQEALKKQGVKE
ncbi:MAG: FAD-dependent oxidoreductase, partial [Planctomycetes bacterium]|nr:FAD-dependent oxidoreductase [Planctomycetota bacterium]